MIIQNADLSWSQNRPFENKSPLIVDPNAVQSLEVVLQRFQFISWGGFQVVQDMGIMQHVEFSGDHLLDSLPFSLLGHFARLKELLELSHQKGLNGHTKYIPI